MLTRLLVRLFEISKVGIVFAGHGVAASVIDQKVESLHLPLRDFEKIVELLEVLDFDFLGVGDLVELSNRKFLHKKHWVHLTFDDGYQNNFDVIYPLLRRKRIPFSIFISTSYPGSRDRFPTFWVRIAEAFGKDLAQLYRNSKLFGREVDGDFECALINLPFSDHNFLVGEIKKLFTPDELASIESRYRNDAPISLCAIQEMSEDPLVHLGGHSHFHLACHGNQALEAGVDNMRRSLATLRDDWQCSPNPAFCYPNGNHSQFWVDECRKLGVPLSFISDAGYIDCRTDSQRMPRFWLSGKAKIFGICLLGILGNATLQVVIWLRRNLALIISPFNRLSR